MASRFIIKHADLKQLTYDVVAAGFADQDVTNITISAGDPETWAELPMVSINLTSDSMVNTHIGHSIDDELIADEDQVYAGVGAIFSQVVEVSLWTTNKEQRDRVGRILKEALFLYGQGTDTAPGPFVTTPGIAEVRISGGADQSVVDTAQQYSPHALHMRTYFVSALADLTGQEPAGQPVSDVLTQGAVFQVDIFQEDGDAPSL